MKPTISGKWSMIWIVVLIVGLQTGGLDKVLGPVFSGMQRVLPGCSSCLTGGIVLTRPEGFPEEFVVPKGAEGVGYSIKNSIGLGYSVHEKPDEFPTYLAIEKRFTEFGWKKLKHRLDEPELENNQQWEQGHDELESYSLKEYWVNSSNEVIFAWYYYYKTDFKNRGYMTNVYLGYHKKMSDKVIIYKQLHPEEFEGIEVVE